MRKALILTTCTLIIFLQTPYVSANSSSYSYNRDKIQEAIFLDKNNLLFYLETAHLSDPLAEYPFQAIQQIHDMSIFQNVRKGYVRSALNALKWKNYRTAEFYWRVIQHFEPDNQQANYYLQEINRFYKGVINEIALVDFDKRDIAVPVKVAENKSRPTQTVQKATYQSEPVQIKAVVSSDEEKTTYTTANKPVEHLKKNRSSEKTTIEYDLTERQIESDFEPIIRMDDELWSKQPNTEMEIEVGQSIILEGLNVRRFLVVGDDYIDVDRIDANEMRVSSLKRGSTFLHVWDERGRWTFNVSGITPARRVLKKSKDINVVREKYADTFKVSQNMTWSGFYSGPSADNLDRDSLIFRNWVGFWGATPYGELDGGVTFNKFAQSTELIEQTLGLTDASIGNFKDFNVRVWDSARRFSDLTIPGRNFRGLSFDKYEYDRNFRWSYIRGKDRSTASAVTPDSTDFRDSWIEGARFVLYPENPDHNYAFNFARGWGEAREPGLKDRVYSVETNQKYKDWKLYGELAYDEDDISTNVSAKRYTDEEKIGVFFRNIDEDFRTATGRPINDGEIGTLLRYDKKINRQWEISADMDLYQDRSRENVDNPHHVNMDIGARSYYDIDKKTKLTSSMYALNTPQLVSPITNFRLNNTLSRIFEIWEDKRMTAFIGHTFQSNRYSLNAPSEFDRNSIRGGIRMPLIKNTNYYASYEQSWVDEKFTDTRSSPSLFETGLGYNRYLGKKVTANVSTHYRNEQEAEGNFSFLSGSDDWRTSVGLSYRPTDEMEIYMDGSYRTIWTEANDEDARTEIDLRMGVRTTWDTMFSWNSKGIVGGIVWNDINNNGVYDLDESGIPGVDVRVGKQVITTNENGFYAAKVSAESVIVDIDLETLPKGFLVTTGTLKEVEVVDSQDTVLDFGLVAQTSMHGLVFVDKNSNGQYDRGEKLIPDVKIALDDIQEFSGYNGEFRFVGVEPGLHEVRIDISSIPMEYLPQIKLKNQVIVEEGAGLEFLIPLQEK